ncbi:MAG: DUF3822 family protein [Paludibacteraceae bacterium]|nr:DUF3822 family protein [Paludibacteraceae bacterium]
MLTSAFSLIPQHLYQEENADLWLNFLRPRIPRTQRIVAQSFPEFELVCVYEDGISRHKHVIPTLLTAASAASAGTETNMSHTQDNMGAEKTTALYALRQEDRLAVVCIIHGQLQLANIYEADTKEQALFWLLKIYDQFQLPHTTSLYIQCGDTTFRLLNAHIPTFPLGLDADTDSCE